MKNLNIYILLLAILSMTIFYSCEEEFVPDTINAEQQYIIEGYVEASEIPKPTYVIITKSIPYFSELSVEGLSDIYVKNAKVKVNDGEKDIELTHFCLDELPDNVKQFIKKSFGLDSINNDLNFCAYVDISNELNVKEGKIYTLNIEVSGKTIKSSTTIPVHVPLDSLWFEQVPGKPIDTLRQLYCRITDPVDERNYYRFRNGYVNGPLVTPFVSIIGDDLFNGKDFKFPLDRAVSSFSRDSTDISYIYFKTGDTVQVQWMCVDKDQYEFWNTLELDRVQQGPFSSYIRAKTNIDGALGVWSGMSSRIYKVAN